MNALFFVQKHIKINVNIISKLSETVDEFMHNTPQRVGLR